jgi:hypothetical protein
MMKAFIWGLLAGAIMRIVFGVTDVNSTSLDISRMLTGTLVGGILLLVIVVLAELLRGDKLDDSPNNSAITDKGQTL